MKKFNTISLLLVLSMVFLAACGGSADNSGNTDSESGSTAEGEKVTLELWHYWGDNLEAELKRNVDEFNESQSEIEIVPTFIPYDELTQQLLVSATSGDIPDLIIGGINEVQLYADAGVLEDITTQVTESGKSEEVYENILDIHKVDDKYYGLPLHTNAVALFYNTDLVEEPPTTWEELSEMAKELTTDDTYGFAASAHNSQHGTASWIPFLWSTGVDVDNLESPEAAKALALWKDMIDEGAMSKEVVNKELEDIAADFYTGRAAMIIGGSWSMPVIEAEAPDLNWAVAEIPRDKNHTSVVGGESIAIGKGQNVEAAWQFIDWLLEPERQLEWDKAMGNFPTGSEVASDPYFQDNDALKVFVDVIQTSQGYGWGENHNEINSAIYSAIQDTLAGGLSPEEALSKASEKIAPILEQ
mgnify:CR=1 FL=1